VSESERREDTDGVSTPGYPPYGAPPPPQKRRRPSAWWFVLAVGLMVAGVAVGVTVLVLTIKGFTETDATIAADGQPHQVTVETDQERMVWVDDSEPASCTIVDTETGAEVSYTGSPDASYTKSTGGRDWEGDRTFEPGSGDLEVTCDESGGPIQIGPAPDFGDFFGGLALGIFLPFFLGGVGFLLLIVLAVLFATGRPRRLA
jgi:hypothetical protein